MSNEEIEQGKYFVCEAKGDRGDFFIYCYILKVVGNVVAYKWLLFVNGMERIENNEWMKKWRFNVGKKDLLSKDLVPCYPLQLILLNFFKAPSKYISKKQRSIIMQSVEIENGSQKQIWSINSQN